MILKINREDDMIIIKKDNSLEAIETYRTNETVTFKSLMTFLLSEELKEEITINNTVSDLNDAETDLIKLLEYIIEQYNNKVKDYQLFLKEREEQKS